MEGFYTLNYQPVGATGYGSTLNLFNSTSQIGAQGGTASIASLINVFTPLSLGGGGALASSYTPNNRSAFVISELLVVTGPYVGQNSVRQLIEGYLAWKWWPGSGSTVLPSSHPYSGGAPTLSAPLTVALVDRYSQTADATVANTTATTTIVGAGVGGVLIPGNTFVLGKTYGLTMSGLYNTASSAPTLTVTVALGGVTLAQKTISNLQASASGATWDLGMNIVCRAAGASGSLVVTGSFDYDITATSRNSAPMNNGGSAITIDTTLDASLTITVAWGAASASNSITSKLFEVVSYN